MVGRLTPLIPMDYHGLTLVIPGGGIDSRWISGMVIRSAGHFPSHEKIPAIISHVFSFSHVTRASRLATKQPYAMFEKDNQFCGLDNQVFVECQPEQGLMPLSKVQNHPLIAVGFERAKNKIQAPESAGYGDNFNPENQQVDTGAAGQ